MLFHLKMKFQLPFIILTYYCNSKNQLQIIFTFEVLPHLMRLLPRPRGKSSKVQCNC